MRVLLVEDGADLAEYARVVLRRHDGITVEVTSDGLVAVDPRFRSAGTDILITDIGLPGTTGLELATNPGMPIAMITASDQTRGRRVLDGNRFTGWVLGRINSNHFERSSYRTPCFPI